MGKSGRGFGLEVMRNSKLKNKFKNKPNKRKILNMMVPYFLYSNSYHFLISLLSSLLLLLAFFFLFLIIILTLLLPTEIVVRLFL